jgi:dehydrogenase/reductase SDR family member 12
MQELAGRGATLYMVCRSAERGQAAVDAVRAASGNADVHLRVRGGGGG